MIAYKKDPFGELSDGREIFLHTLYNDDLSVSISEYGACIVKLIYHGIDVVSGMPNALAYEGKVGSMGFTIGRYANRIAKGEFELNGKHYNLVKNNGNNHLHGGVSNLSTKVYDVNRDDDGLHFKTTSPNGEEHYPGNLAVEVVFNILEPSTLCITYLAQSDEDTILNVTNHSYFNLNGHNDGSIKKHSLWINATQITESNAELIPTGKFIDVVGTPFDFRQTKEIGEALKETERNVYLNYAGGLDHNFVLNKGEGLEKIASLVGDKTNITMNTYTTEPGVQIYTACKTDIANGKDNAHYLPYSLVCLETQHFPDSVHHEHFPSVVLKANDKFYSQTRFEFEG